MTKYKVTVHWRIATLVMAWASEHCQNYNGEHQATTSKPYDDPSHYDLLFNNESDAILVKMRWT